MTLIVVLVSLVIERFFYWGQLRNWRWFVRYEHLINKRISQWHPYLLLAACVLPLLILVGGIQFLLSGWLFGTLSMAFGILILLYCFGPENLWVQTYGCLNELHNVDQSVAVEKVRSAFGIELPENAQLFHQLFVNHIFIAAYYRIFAVVFWYLVLGPLGAVLYRLIELLHTDSPLGITQLATQAQKMMDWIPVRVFTFLFALGGHFTAVFTHWKKYVLKGVESNNVLLQECGLSALDVLDQGKIPEDGAAEKEAIELVDRVFIIGLVILAILTLLR